MSGGRFNYMDSTLKNEIFGYGDNPTNAFGDWEISNLVWDILELIHDWDWYASGDTGEDAWCKSKVEFKRKWLKGGRVTRLKKIVDKAVSELKEELYDMIIIEEEWNKRHPGGGGDG